MDNYESRPILSVVIANYNYGRYLADALESIIKQDAGRDVEIIICDAASTDNSIVVIREYEKHIAWWCSEKDGGQSEAFNKGFSHARGEWLTWLNADEIYLPGVLKRLLAFIRQHPAAEWITANDLIFDDKTKMVTCVKWGPHWQPNFLRKRRTSFAVFGPTTFFKKSLYERMGPIDETLHFAMDFDYWMRLIMAGVRQCRFNCHCWAFRVHEESKTSGERAVRQLHEREAEFQRIQDKNGYHYRHSLSNPWYWIWILLRVIDGSFFIRAWKRLVMQGRCIEEFV